MQLQNIYIKETGANDFNDIMKVEEQAFGNKKEAQLTADLLVDSTANPILSLLAFHNNEAVGHILFTRVYINQIDIHQRLIHILAPLAVIPTYQKQGIGGLLITEGLKRLKAKGSHTVFVLGHIEYYPKYGFICDAHKLGYTAPFPIPEEVKDAWMVQSLNKGESSLEKGKVICANELNKPEHWRE